MNVKLITKAMHTLSLLSEDDVQMVMKLRGLSEDERQMLMLVLEPGTKPSKKSSKKSVGGGDEYGTQRTIPSLSRLRAALHGLCL